MTRRGAPGRGTAGFTLIEVLVALTLLSLLGIMLSDGLRFGVRAWERTREASSRVGDVAAVQRFLRNRLEGPTRPEGFGGEAGRLRFEALWLAELGAGAFHRFGVAHDAVAGSGGALVLSWEPADPLVAPGSSLVGNRILLDGVEAAAVWYFGSADDDETPRWREDWPEGGTAPSLVRIDLRFTDTRRVWPLFVARTEQ